MIEKKIFLAITLLQTLTLSCSRSPKYIPSNYITVDSKTQLQSEPSLYMCKVAHHICFYDCKNFLTITMMQTPRRSRSRSPARSPTLRARSTSPIHAIRARSRSPSPRRIGSGKVSPIMSGRSSPSGMSWLHEKGISWVSLQIWK